MEDWQIAALVFISTAIVGAITAWITTRSQQRKSDSEAAEKLTDAAIALIEPYRAGLIEALASAARHKTELEATLDKSRAFTARIEHLESELASLRRENEQLRKHNAELLEQLSKMTCTLENCEMRKTL